MTDLEKAREFFKNDRYAMTTGIEIEEVGENYAKCRLKINESHQNANGHVMGGVIFTLADFTFAVSTNLNRPITVTTSSQICYLSTPEGDTLFAESKLLKDGKRSCFYEICITDNLGNFIAVVTTNGTHICNH